MSNNNKSYKLRELQKVKNYLLNGFVSRKAYQNIFTATIIHLLYYFVEIPIL